jgi:hypothetical protein
MAQSVRLLRPIRRSAGGGPVGPPPPRVTYRIKLENDFILLRENGDKLRKEQST